MPCPFRGPKTFCAGPNFLHQPKNLTAFKPCLFTGPKMFCAGPHFFVSDQRFIQILCKSQTFCAKQKDDLHSYKLVFMPAQVISASTKTFVPAQKPILLSANHLSGTKNLDQLKTFWDLKKYKA